MKKILIDWIAFTLVKEKEEAPVINLFPLSPQDFSPLPKGGLGYKKIIACSGIKIFTDGAESMGVHTQISGQGCRFLEALGVDLWAFLSEKKKEKDLKFTRLDIALDVDTDLITPCVESIRKGLYISKSRSIKLYEKIGEDKKMHVETIYIGSRSSKVFFRIYDKAKQMKVGGIWQRIEAEVKKDYIITLIEKLESSISDTFCGLLLSYFRPISKKESNISRSPTADYWLKLIGECKKVTLYREPKKKGVEEKFLWIDSQVAPTVALLSEAFGGYEWIEAVAKRAKSRVKPIDWKILEEEKL
ncbi:replication initiation factor domain-containing protein [Peptoniphilus sp. KCTC 25270]|uniref:replication initiation factor domain-containing protein n=1 Tax=Peptoniphilus sp. KCTC 25270 TaxID=2897414 RepID=UPI001E28B844|nr:replication initiation factor domain-containing protein [Peptoniphilus sp. KCTC 25270]MCD1147761.1 replication initiation factor domain-containing protein [Peptoniphilus sp. KCTC 25270]